MGLFTMYAIYSTLIPIGACLVAFDELPRYVRIFGAVILGLTIMSAFLVFRSV